MARRKTRTPGTAQYSLFGSQSAPLPEIPPVARPTPDAVPPNAVPADAPPPEPLPAAALSPKTPPADMRSDPAPANTLQEPAWLLEIPPLGEATPPATPGVANAAPDPDAANTADIDADPVPDPCPAVWRDFVPMLRAGEHMPLVRRVAALRRRVTVYPAQDNLFAALKATPPQAVRVVILGQDPYHGPGQAHGLCFSVQPPCPAPPSLCNIFKEIQDDVYAGAPLPHPSACLDRWAEQGVLLLNTILSVQAGRALSHANLGWQRITRDILTALAADHPLAVLLWGRPARDAAAGLFPAPPHLVLCAPHPSPLSAHRGFFGCRHFSRVNDWLGRQGLPPIRW